MVVDDDVALAEMIGIVLTSEGYTPDYCADGAQALTLVRQTRPDLVLLDLMLPGMDGIEVCRELRKESGVPVVMVTAKSDTKDIVEGLAAGADDYILKPFKPAELVARVKARLRRKDAHEPADGERLRVGDVVINVPGHEVRKAGRPVSLTPLEFDLLLALASKPWQVFTREMLLERVWGYKNAADTRLVNVHVQRLRAKVETDPDSPSVVVTVRGVGYRAGRPE
jgi:two-component system response regulator MtrA